MSSKNLKVVPKSMSLNQAAHIIAIADTSWVQQNCYFFLNCLWSRTRYTRPLHLRHSYNPGVLLISRAEADSIGVPTHFVSNVLHVQWAIPQTRNEGSMFIQVRALFWYWSFVYLFSQRDFRFHDLSLRHAYLSMHISHILLLELLDNARDRHH